MALQSGLRGLCIFKSLVSCCRSFFFFFFGALIQLSSLHGVHIFTVGTELLRVAESHSLSLLCHEHVMWALSSLRQDKMFTAVEMSHINTNLSFFQTQAVPLWLACFLCSDSLCAIIQWITSRPLLTSPHPFVSVFIVTGETSCQHVMYLSIQHSSKSWSLFVQ